eukprot:Opistho-1_new@96910
MEAVDLVPQVHVLLHGLVVLDLARVNLGLEGLEAQLVARFGRCAVVARAADGGRAPAHGRHARVRGLLVVHDVHVSLGTEDKREGARRRDKEADAREHKLRVRIRLVDRVREGQDDRRNHGDVPDGEGNVLGLAELARDRLGLPREVDAPCEHASLRSVEDDGPNARIGLARVAEEFLRRIVLCHGRGKVHSAPDDEVNDHDGAHNGDDRQQERVRRRAQSLAHLAVVEDGHDAEVLGEERRERDRERKVAEPHVEPARGVGGRGDHREDRGVTNHASANNDGAEQRARCLDDVMVAVEEHGDKDDHGEEFTESAESKEGVAQALVLRELVNARSHEDHVIAQRLAGDQDDGYRDGHVGGAREPERQVVRSGRPKQAHAAKRRRAGVEVARVAVAQLHPGVLRADSRRRRRLELHAHFVVGTAGFRQRAEGIVEGEGKVGQRETRGDGDRASGRNAECRPRRRLVVPILPGRIATDAQRVVLHEGARVRVEHAAADAGPVVGHVDVGKDDSTNAENVDAAACRSRRVLRDRHALHLHFSRRCVGRRLVKDTAAAALCRSVALDDGVPVHAQTPARHGNGTAVHVSRVVHKVPASNREKGGEPLHV